MTGFLQRDTCGSFPLQRKINQLSEVHSAFPISTAGKLGVTTESGTFGSKRFPTLVASRPAGHWRPFANRHVAKFARHSTFTSINLAVKNNTSTDSRFDQDKNEIPHLAHLRATKPEFRQSRGISIVINADRQANSSS